MYSFEAAFQRALNQMRKEMQSAFSDFQKNPTDLAIQARWETYRSIIERLDALI